MGKIKITLKSSLKERQIFRFGFIHKSRHAEGILVLLEGQLLAYENKCRHLPLKLDAASNGQFFSSDGNHFICQTHNALYEPTTGLCVRGPCEGESLRKLNVTVEGDAVWLEEE
jgi:nitrite reductase/ring-hydroxylating ferredoxin subunit